MAYTQPHGIRPPRVDFDPVYYNTAGEFILEGGVAAVPGNWSIGGTLTVAGQATFNGGFANPAALRNASNLNIDGLTTHGDSAYAILATDRVVATSAAFTASRTWTLPAANAVNPGQSLTITDEANGITSTNTLVVSRAGSDTVVAQGTTVSSITLSSAGALITLISDGSSKWIVQSLRQAPQVSVFTSGTSQTYTTSIGALYLRVRMVGDGGGGGALSTNAGSVGTDTSFRLIDGHSREWWRSWRCGRRRRDRRRKQHRHRHYPHRRDGRKRWRSNGHNS